MAFRRQALLLTERTSDFQIGGSGENNLPRLGITILKKNAATLILGTNNLAEYFETKSTLKAIWTEALHEFIMPFCTKITFRIRQKT